MRPVECFSITEWLERRAAEAPDSPLYTFLIDGEQEEVHLSCGAAHERACAIAAHLQSIARPGERALLIFPPGLDFITAFFGCLYAGIVAVPAFPPRNARNVPRIASIVADCQPKICLVTSNLLRGSENFSTLLPQLAEARWVATDQVETHLATEWKRTSLARESLAYLQYTSGSTNNPKGVMIAHGNLLANLSFICDQWGHQQGYRIVSWAPFFHDMGLIYGVLQPLYGGAHSILMPPASFLQRPFRWLHALSRFRADSTVAPNFAYDLCAKKITEAEKAQLDLSNWTRAHNAAEPVRLDTLERFAAAFAPCGFRPEALKPGYGLAEATLAVTFTRKGKAFRSDRISKLALGQHRVAEPTDNADALDVVGCGESGPDLRVLIVNPETRSCCAEDTVGEIWISGSSVAAGYWGRHDQTEETFRAFTASGEGPFLRTGDLGFMKAGELYVTGRLKDMILIRGVNHYPQDIERTVQSAHSALQPDAGAAFGIEVNGEERLVVVQEVVRHHHADLNEVTAAIRAAIAETHGVETHAIVLIRPNSLPKTTSGKIQRHAAKRLFLEGKLKVECEWRTAGATGEGSRGLDRAEPPTATEPATEAALPTAQNGTTRNTAQEAAALEQWLRRRLATLLGLKPEDFDLAQPFSRYGLDSLQAAAIAGELQDKLQRRLPPSLLFDFPSIARLTRFLAGADDAEAAAGDESAAKSREPIAVVGLGCRFPGAESPEEFWNLLLEGRDAIREVPRDRWNAGAFYDPAPGTPGKMNTRWGGFLRNVAEFDAEFFEISPREAVQMDPQQRLALEVTWQALEHAGIAPAELAGSKTGVFLGISSFDYALLQIGNSAAINAYAGTGMAHSVAANRISYFLDLRGPSIAVDTACSSSLVAVHQACEGLRRGEADLALAGGVNLVLLPELTVALSQARMLASDGRCKTFDARADGYVRGEGCGIVVLKRLSDALRDGNSILALIAGSAVNQDGHSNGLTAPNGPAQEAVISLALRNAGVAPREISFVECHGTGTPLGDPQEVQALQHVLGAGRGPEHRCWIASVKTNIGHLEAAAGIAGLIKTILCLQNKTIPAHLHLQTLNPHLRLNETAFAIPRQRLAWPCGGRRVAGVSSFGFGGTNAHVIVAEAADLVEQKPARDMASHLLALSAKTPQALRSLARAFAQAREWERSLGDICFTAAVGRSHFRHRLAMVVDSAVNARAELARFAAGETSSACWHGVIESGTETKVAFVFPGDASQCRGAGVGRQLYEAHPVFRDTFDRCDRVAREWAGVSLVEWLFSNSPAGSELEGKRNAQLAWFAVEIALAELWRSWGVIPDAVLGEDTCEYAAACVAGIFSLEESLRLVAARAVDGFDDANFSALDTRPSSGAGARVVKELERVCGAIDRRPAKIPMVSSATGDWLPEESTCDAASWARPLVQFARGIQTLVESGYTHFLVCGPESNLPGRARQNTSDDTGSTTRWLHSWASNGRGWPVILDALAQLYIAGRAVDWRGFYRESPYRRVVLPGYPWEKSHFWISRATSSRPPADSSELDGEWGRLTQIGFREFEAEEWGFEWRVEQARVASLEALSRAYVSRALERLGFFAGDALGDTLEAKLERLQVSPQQRRVVEMWLRRFDPSVSHATASTGALPEPKSVDEIEALWREAVRAWGDPHVPDLVRRCGERLSEVLAGEIDPLTLLFPHGDFSVVEKLYRDCGLAKSLNAVMARLVAQIADQRADTDPLRILEVGGGTGGTTFHVLPLLSKANVRYTFTDVGPGFVHQAQERFKTFPFFSARVLDLERDPESQGVLPGNFDLVIAANVFHATRDIRATLERVRSLLSPGGHLLVWETTEPRWWLDITFGLLEGWRRFHGDALRPAHPLLSPEAWINALRQAGFDRAEEFPAPSQLQFGQHIFLARAKVNAPVETSGRGGDSVQAPDAPRNLFYRVEWVKLSDPFPAPPGHSETAPGTWLLFADRGGFARSLAEVIRKNGGHPVLVTAGRRYRRDEGKRFSLEPGNAEHLRTLFEDLARSGGAPLVRILHGWNLDDDARQPTRSTWLRHQKLGIETIAALARHLVTDPNVSGRRDLLWILTRGGQPANLDEKIVPGIAQAHLWGLAKVIALEHPSLWGGIVDLDPRSPAGEEIACWRLCVAAGAERQMALRDDAVVAPRLRVDASATRGQRVRFATDATYLITGGLGGMGLQVARWMVGRGARRLVLMGRSKLPPRRDWKEAVKRHDPVAAKLAAILELEKAGASVHLASVDVANERQLAGFLKRFEREGWPAIRGVIHAAGVLEDRTLLRLDRSAIDAVLRPKVLGAWNLHCLFKDAPLDFFVLFSSVAAVLGSAGQANHAAANAFLDSLAHFRRRQSLAAQTINWGPWSEVGAAARHSDSERFAAHGISFLSPDQGLAAMEILMSSGSPQSMVLAVDWRAAGANAGWRTPFFSDVLPQTPHDSADSLAENVRSNHGLAALDESAVQQKLIEAAATLLMQAPERVAAREPLSRLGFDSLMAVQLQNEIELHFGCALPLDEIGRCSITELTGKVLRALSDRGSN